MFPLGRYSKTIVQVLNQISQVWKGLSKVAKYHWFVVLNGTLVSYKAQLGFQRCLSLE